jgi:tetratricopeptide (TPR) repeat protein
MKPFVLMIALALAAPARACLWDDDTLADEKRGLPGMAALLADKYERHSAFFYEKRIERARADLAKSPADARAHDNLAVALDRLGRHEEALQAALAKDRVLPGQYTTHANLGTIYYHLGRLEPSVAHIERALAIDPKAHFGREEYQLRLVRQELALSKNPELAKNGPLGVPFSESHCVGDVEAWRKNGGFRSDPIEAVAGIIRFSNPRAPQLWYILGELLSMRGDKHFAIRAFSRAIEAGHPRAQELKEFIDQMRGMMTDESGIAPEVIARERLAGATWRDAYQTFEDDALRRGELLESDEAYAPFYARHGTRDHEPWWTGIVPTILRYSNGPRGWFSLAFILILLRFFVRRLRAR